MRPIRFLLEFLALSLPLTWVFLEWGLSAYAPIFQTVANALYDVLGLGIQAGPARLRFINVVPFLVLVLLTPGLSHRRRFGGLGLGLLVLGASHIALDAYATWAAPGRMQLPTGAALVSDALPLVLWVAIAHDFVRDATGPLFARATPGSDE